MQNYQARRIIQATWGQKFSRSEIFAAQIVTLKREIKLRETYWYKPKREIKFREIFII